MPGLAPPTLYTDHARMFAEMDLDLVYFCLPPFAHRNEVELACTHGVHFLVEKPIALTLEQAVAMARQVERSGVTTQVGFQLLHGAAVQWLRRAIDAVGNPSGFLIGRYACNSLHSWW